MAEVAVVTGAGGGIGRVLVEALGDKGYDVIGLDLPRACPADDPRYRACDIADEAAVGEAFAPIDRIDLLIHSAGLSAIGAFQDHDIDVHRKVMEVTHFGAVAVTQAALPALNRAHGRVVLIGSVAGFAPVLGRPPYVAAKHAVTALFTAIRPELEAQGVSVTIVHPTFVAGGMTEAGRAPGAQRKTTGDEITSEDVAAALIDGVERGRDMVLVGRTAKLAWTVSRLAPSLYMKLMIRRMHNNERGAT